MLSEQYCSAIYSEGLNKWHNLFKVVYSQPNLHRGAIIFAEHFKILFTLIPYNSVFKTSIKANCTYLVIQMGKFTFVVFNPLACIKHNNSGRSNIVFDV